MKNHSTLTRACCFCQTLLCCLLLLELCSVAFAAIDRTVALRNEGNASWLATLCADGLEHFTLAAGIVARCLAGIAAVLAASGLILETLFGVESLFTGSKDEFLAAVLAYKSLVFVHWKITPKIMINRAIG